MSETAAADPLLEKLVADFGNNYVFALDQLEQYRQDPRSVEKGWSEYFDRALDVKPAAPSVPAPAKAKAAPPAAAAPAPPAEAAAGRARSGRAARPAPAQPRRSRAASRPRCSGRRRSARRR